MRRAKGRGIEDEKKRNGVSEVKRTALEREMGMLLRPALSAFSL